MHPARATPSAASSRNTTTRLTLGNIQTMQSGNFQLTMTAILAIAQAALAGYVAVRAVRTQSQAGCAQLSPSSVRPTRLLAVAGKQLRTISGLLGPQRPAGSLPAATKSAAEPATSLPAAAESAPRPAVLSATAAATLTIPAATAAISSAATTQRLLSAFSARPLWSPFQLPAYWRHAGGKDSDQQSYLRPIPLWR